MNAKREGKRRGGEKIRRREEKEERRGNESAMVEISRKL